MATVEIEVNGRAYRLNCEDGQEGRLRELAGYVDQRLRALTGGGKAGSDAQMLLMTALVLADELQETAAGRGIPMPAAPAAGPAMDEAAVAAALDGVARRIEGVAARLERA